MPKSIITDISRIFYPNICVGCNNVLFKKEMILCVSCRHDLPILIFTDYKKNEIASTFYGIIPVKKAVSFLRYTPEGKAKKLIHSLKYRGNQKIGTFIGKWFGKKLKETKKFDNIQQIIPVPLHKKRLKKRGYNQLTKFGKALAEELNSEYTPNILIRKKITDSQTKKSRLERFENKDTIFYLTDTSFFKNKNVLLIDDVITTGATLISCCKELLKTNNITINIATIAFTEKN